MNKYIFILLLLICSCSQDETSYLELSSNNLEVGWEQGSAEVFVNANTKWHITSELPSWLSVLTSPQGGNTTSLLVTTEENDSDEARHCEITIGASEHILKLHVIQKAKEKLFFLEQNGYEIESAGTTLNIPVERNVNYELAVSKNAEDWITLHTDGATIGGPHFKSREKYAGKESLRLNIAANYQKTERHADIIIYNAFF